MTDKDALIRELNGIELINPEESFMDINDALCTYWEDGDDYWRPYLGDFLTTEDAEAVMEEILEEDGVERLLQYVAGIRDLSANLFRVDTNGNLTDATSADVVELRDELLELIERYFPAHNTVTISPYTEPEDKPDNMVWIQYKYECEIDERERAAREMRPDRIIIEYERR